MKKFLVFMFACLLLSPACFASCDKEINNAYKVIKKLIKAEDTVNLKQYILSNSPYSKEAIVINSDELIKKSIKDNGNPEIISLLVKYGTGVDKRYRGGNTALMIATDFNADADLIKKLIQIKSDVNATDRAGSTPLFTLCRRHPDSSAIYMLIDEGADLFSINKNGKTPYSILPYDKRNEILKYYNKTRTKFLMKECLNKNTSYLISKYGLPDNKIALDKNRQIWEYDIIKQHYIELSSSSNYSPQINCSRTSYSGGYTVKIVKKYIFNISGDLITSVSFSSSYNTSK